MSKIPESFRDRSVCILGLGYVGLTLAVAMADAGFQVLGVEIRDDAREKLARGKPHFYEPKLAEHLGRAVGERRIIFSKHIPAGSSAAVYIITVGTPLNENGSVRLDMVSNVAEEVSRNLRDGDMVVVRSTVKLGTTQKVVLPILEQSGKTFDLTFCPERTLAGQALPELRSLPQIIGGATYGATLRAAQLFQFMTPTIVRVADIETAEMIKLVDNAQRDVWFAYANEVARICDAVGVSAAEVIQSGALGYPRRNLPMPGPVGGPCLSKDSHILAEGLGDYRIEPEITMMARRLNERQPKEVVAQLAATLKQLDGYPSQPSISLMGIAFKGRPPTDDLRGTMARPILDALREHFPKAECRGFDAVVPGSSIGRFGLTPCRSIEEVMDGAHLVIIANNHRIFAEMPIESLAVRLARPGLIYDFWNNFDARDLHLPEGVGYMALGSHGRAALPSKGPLESRRRGTATRKKGS